MGKIGEKGVILKSSVRDNVKVTLALFQPDEGEPRLLAKPTVKKLLNKRYTYSNPYKAWLYPSEVASIIALLQRALAMMDEYAEGTLDLQHILAEDEDARLFTANDSVMMPEIDTAFDLSPHVEKDAELMKEQKQATLKKYGLLPDDLDEPMF